jgi:superfamily II DNA helicase RecQ
MLDYITFLSCLEFAVLNSLYRDNILKPKQVLCLESMYCQRDVMCVLPTGYGKSLIFHLLPMLFAKYNLQGDVLRAWKSKSFSTALVKSIVIVVSPLNSLINDQISQLGMSGIRASIINVKETRRDQIAESDDTDSDDILIDIDLCLCDEQKLQNGLYNIVFAHPESFISCKYGRELLVNEKYQENVVAIVIDEAHCILDWLVFISYIKYIITIFMQ